ncbi:holo-ACP synthase [Magnetospirillum sp. SS-4]|uniref:holo-ACP synthase n=1 Tax=Magnetospirillum sp. SS-4 TaxID=2681465 RepID=UPI00137F1512|nr:holo-ACP synthase [Magnetospirillum sp. SS-4]CAA7613761.1 holo-(acyl-carrier-protein) synthase 1 [Magnetospirillum sp. SS-4]
MILGLGSDLIDIRRIEKTLERFGERFIDRVFTPVERAKAERRTETMRAATYAKRYAAKEAAAKALGTGFREGVFWRDIGVVNTTNGRPTLALTGGAAARLALLLPAGMTARIDLTMTDEYPMAEAVVIISAIPG